MAVVQELTFPHLYKTEPSTNEGSRIASEATPKPQLDNNALTKEESNTLELQTILDEVQESLNSDNLVVEVQYFQYLPFLSKIQIDSIAKLKKALEVYSSTVIGKSPYSNFSSVRYNKNFEIKESDSIKNGRSFTLIPPVDGRFHDIPFHIFISPRRRGFFSKRSKQDGALPIQAEEPSIEEQVVQTVLPAEEIKPITPGYTVKISSKCLVDFWKSREYLYEDGDTEAALFAAIDSTLSFLGRKKTLTFNLIKENDLIFIKPEDEEQYYLKNSPNLPIWVQEVFIMIGEESIDFEPSNLTDKKKNTFNADEYLGDIVTKNNILKEKSKRIKEEERLATWHPYSLEEILSIFAGSVVGGGSNDFDLSQTHRKKIFVKYLEQIVNIDSSKYPNFEDLQVMQRYESKVLYLSLWGKEVKNDFVQPSGVFGQFKKPVQRTLILESSFIKDLMSIKISAVADIVKKQRRKY